MKGIGAALVVLLGVLLYAMGASQPEGAAGVRSDEGAYRLRLCELALFSGESARSDRLLEFREAALVPYGAFAPAATAFVLARTLPEAAFDLDRGTLDEDALVRGTRGLWLSLTWFASFGLLFAGLRFMADPPRSFAAAAVAWLAALSFALFALLPAVDGGSVRHEVWGLGLGALILGQSSLLMQPRSLLDQLCLAIGAGALLGLALCNDPLAWPLFFAPWLAWLLAGRRSERSPSRDRWRGALFFVATALFVSGQGGAWSMAAPPWPTLQLPWQTPGSLGSKLWVDVLAVLLAAWLVLFAPRTPQRGLLAVLLLGGIVLRFLDGRFSGALLAPAGCAFVVFVAGLWRQRLPSIARRGAALAGCVLLPVLAFGSARAEHEAAVVEALRDLRTLTRSSGAWNHALARQEYALLANPCLAGSIAFHARRPVVGAKLSGARATPSARSAAEALLRSSPAELAASAHELNTPYVVVGASDWQRLDELLALSGRRAQDFGPERARGLVLRELLLRSEIEGFELLRRVPDPRAADGLAQLAVWRLTAPGPARAPASMRAR